jgi:branched-chain amino acid transport system permease protein
VLGAVYTLVATGFAIAMVPSGVFNFAQGAIVVLGSFMSYQLLSVAHVATVLGIALSCITGMLAGLLCEVIAVRPLRIGRGGSETGALVTTVGASTVIVGIMSIKWGSLPLQVPFPGATDYIKLHIFGITARPVELTAVGTAILSAFIVHFLFRRTRVGHACLAVAEDREPAMLVGINVSAFSLAAFALAGAFGGLAGMVVGPITYAEPTLGATLALYGFVAVALGGQGSVLGGLIGGMLVGLVASLATRYIGAAYADIAVLALLLSALGLRPGGLGGLGAARDV